MMRRLLALEIAFNVTGTLPLVRVVRLLEISGQPDLACCSGEDREFHTKRSSGSIKRQYEAKILYNYSVNGEAFKGSQITFMDGRSSAQFLVNKFPAGRQVDVFYNPDEACLKREVDC